MQKKLDDYVVSDPDRLGGEPVFRNTRVPVQTLFAYLRKGLPLEQFLEHFEGVEKQQAIAVLELAALQLTNISERGVLPPQ